MREGWCVVETYKGGDDFLEGAVEKVSRNYKYCGGGWVSLGGAATKMRLYEGLQPQRAEVTDRHGACLYPQEHTFLLQASGAQPW